MWTGILRINLLLLESLLSLFIWAATVNKLSSSTACYFGNQATCNFIVYPTILCWLVHIGLLLTILLGHIRPTMAPRRLIEAYLLASLTFCWLVVAFVALAGKPTSTGLFLGGAVVAAAWINFAAHAVSCGMAFAVVGGLREDRDFSDVKS